MRLSRRDMLWGMAICPLVGAVTSAANGAALVLSLPQSTQGKPLFGTAVRPDQLVPGSSLEGTIRLECDLLVPEYHGQWSAVEWSRGEPYYGNYDAIADYALATGKKVRGHALLWEQMTPDWARREISDARDWSTIGSHFATLLPRYRGRIDEWIVVNEMIDTENGDRGFRRNSFQRAFGNDYVARALETARILDPGAKLMINDHSLSQNNPVDSARRTAMLRLVEGLKTRSIPIDSVGLQGHIELAKGPIPQNELESFLAELAGMGVEIAITELDVMESDRNVSIERRDHEVADAVEQLLEVACAQPAVRSIVTWGLSDRCSWLQDSQRQTKTAQTCSPIDCLGLNRGLPYDSDMRPKPMRKVLDRLIT